MPYRILADENVEAATIDVLNRLGHDVVRVQDIDALGPGVPDEDIADYARRSDRLVLSQDHHFFSEIDPADTAGVLAQRNQRLSARNVGLIVDEIAAHLPQEAVVLEYVSTNWL